MEPSDDRTINYATLIRTEAERVYDAFATADGLDAWFTTGASVDARAGGSIMFRFENWGVYKVNMESTGPVLAAERPRLFTFQWNPVDEQPDYSTTVELTIEPHEEGVKLSVTDGRYPDSSAGQKALLLCASGWGEALTLVKFHLEHGVVY